MGRRLSCTSTIVKRQRFRDLRHQKGKSQRQVSLDLGCSEDYIRKLETGRAKPEITFAFKLAKYFGTTAEDLWQDLC